MPALGAVEKGGRTRESQESNWTQRNRAETRSIPVSHLDFTVDSSVGTPAQFEKSFELLQVQVAAPAQPHLCAPDDNEGHQTRQRLACISDTGAFENLLPLVRCLPQPHLFAINSIRFPRPKGQCVRTARNPKTWHDHSRGHHLFAVVIVGPGIPHG